MDPLRFWEHETREDPNRIVEKVRKSLDAMLRVTKATPRSGARSRRRPGALARRGPRRAYADSRRSLDLHHGHVLPRRLRLKENVLQVILVEAERQVAAHLVEGAWDPVGAEPVLELVPEPRFQLAIRRPHSGFPPSFRPIVAAFFRKISNVLLSFYVAVLVRSFRSAPGVMLL